MIHRMLITVCCFFLINQAVFSQNVPKEEIPSGMEVIRIGTTQILAPQGMKVEKKNGLIIMEDLNIYMSREIAAINARVLEIEEKNAKLEKKIEELSDTIKTRLSNDHTQAESPQ